MKFTAEESLNISILEGMATQSGLDGGRVSRELVESLHGVFVRLASESPAVAAQEPLDAGLRADANWHVINTPDTSIARVSAELLRRCPAPIEKSDAQLLYEAEDLYEKPWGEMHDGERSQYERMASALRARIAGGK